MDCLREKLKVAELSRIRAISEADISTVLEQHNITWGQNRIDILASAILKLIKGDGK